VPADPYTERTRAILGPGAPIATRARVLALCAPASESVRAASAVKGAQSVRVHRTVSRRPLTAARL